MTSWLTAAWASVKQWGWVAAVLGIVAAYFAIRKDGENAVLAEQAKAREQLQNKYSRIDASKPDVDAAVSDLRARSNQPRK